MCVGNRCAREVMLKSKLTEMLKLLGEDVDPEAISVDSSVGTNPRNYQEMS